MGKPVEFGYLAQVVDNDDGIVVDHSLHLGNPADGPLLAPAVERVSAIVARAPRAVTADRGYGEAKVQGDLEALGVRFVAIVCKGRQSAARRAIERAPRFRKLVKWRTGCEGRISALKRSWGGTRSLMDSLAGTEIWCGYGVFAANSQKIAGLTAEKLGAGTSPAGRALQLGADAPLTVDPCLPKSPDPALAVHPRRKGPGS
jgi:IS5 family transposase